MTNYVISSGQFSYFRSLLAGDTEIVQSGGGVDRTQVDGGFLDVLSGGRSADTTVGSGGRYTIASGGVESGATINSGGMFTASAGVHFRGTIVVSGGTALIAGPVGADQTVQFLGSGDLLLADPSLFSAGIAGLSTLGGAIDFTGFPASGSPSASFVEPAGNTSGTLTVVDGGSTASLTLLGQYATSDFVLGAGGSGGISITVSPPGPHHFVVSSGVVVSGLALSAGESVTVLAGGSAYATILSSGGAEVVSSGGYSSGTIVSGGGTLTLGAGGIGRETTLFSGSLEIVGAGGHDGGTRILAGAHEEDFGEVDPITVTWHGAPPTVVSAGGELIIGAGGGGEATVASGGVVRVQSGGGLAPTVTFGGLVLVESGGTTGFSILTGVISSGGKIVVESGGSTHDDTIYGYEHILGGGVGKDLSVSSGGSLFVDHGAILTVADIDELNFDLGYIRVYQGAAISTLVESGGVLVVSGGGVPGGAVASGTTIAADGVFVNSGGVMISSTIGANGVEHVEAGGTDSGGVVTATSPTAEARLMVYSGGTAIGAEIGANGIEYVAGGVAVRNVASGGYLKTQDGGRASGTTVLGRGDFVIASGTTGADTVVSSGGIEVASSGGTASGTVISSGGVEYVRSGGTDSGAVVSSGGALIVSSGGILGGSITLSGGTAMLSGTVAAGHRVSFGGSGGDLVLADPTAFSGGVAGFAVGDAIELANLPYATGETVSFAEAADHASGILTVTDGARSATVDLVGDYRTAVFALGSSGSGGTAISLPSSFTITDGTDLVAAIAAINAAGGNGAANTAYTFDFAPSSGSTVTLTGAPAAIMLADGSTLTIKGNGDTLAAESADGDLVVSAGSVTIDDLTIASSLSLSIRGGQSVTLEATSGQTTAVDGPIGDVPGSGITGGGLFIGGPGAVDLNAANTYSRGTTLDSGATVVLGVTSALGSGAVSIAANAVLRTPGAFTATISRLDGTLDDASLPYVSGARAVAGNGVLTIDSGGAMASFNVGTGVTTAFRVEADPSGGTQITPLGTIFKITNAADLATDIASISAGGKYASANTAYSFDFALPTGSELALTTALGAIALDAGSSLTITGHGATLDGGSTYEGFFIKAGAVTIDDLTISDAVARGGNGAPGYNPGFGGFDLVGAGGGGAGLGGGVFVAAGAAVTLNDVSFATDSAIGGNGGISTPAAGSPVGGSLDGLFGGGGGTPSGVGGVDGLTGGFGGGGDGNAPGGQGGFGGGGGGGNELGDSAGSTGGFGGFGAALGAIQGGGGLGAGGDVFVQQGGSLTIEGGTLGAGTVSGGRGALAGSGLGSGLFIQGDQSVTLAPGVGQTTTIEGVIADQTGSQASLARGDGYESGAGSLVIDGPGTVDLDAANTYTGGTTLGSGAIVVLGIDGTLGSGAVAIAATAVLRTPGVFSNTISQLNGTLDDTGLTYVSGATASVSGGKLTIASGGSTALFAVGSGVTGTFTVKADGGGGSEVTPDAAAASDVFSLATSGGTPVLQGGNVRVYLERGSAVLTGTEPRLQVVAATSGGGTLELRHFDPASASVIDLIGTNFSRADQVLSTLAPNSHGALLDLPGGGAIQFDGLAASALHASNFALN